MKYTYPQIDRTKGYSWNMLQRCLHEVGIEPVSTGDAGGITFLEFGRELTEEEKGRLDTLMAGNPLLPPERKGNVFVIRDVWNQKTLIEEAMGFPYRVFYSESVEGSGDVDQVELHFDQTLTTQQRNKIVSEYGKLIQIV